MNRDLTHLPTLWDQPQGQQSNRTDKGDGEEAISFQQHYAGTYVGKRINSQRGSTDSGIQPEHGGGEPSPVEVFTRIWAFVKKPEHANATMAIFTMLIFAATAGYTVVAYLQRNAMDEANETNKAVQRAIVNFKRVDYTKVRQVNEQTPQWQFSAVFENGGVTAAEQVVAYFNADILASDPSEVTFIGPPNTRVRSTIAPRGEQFFGRVARPLSFFPNEPQILSEPRFFWGWVVYRDVFPHTKPHLTEFCKQFMELKYLPTANGVLQVDLATGDCPGSRHNCTDEYCEDYKDIVEFAK